MLNLGKIKKVLLGIDEQVVEKVKLFPPIPDQVQVYYAMEPTIVDGDTLHMQVKWWGGAEWTKLKLRLSGLNAPEKHTLDGKSSETWVKVWCASVATAWKNSSRTPAPFLIIITGPDKYQPRWNAIVYDTMTSTCLNEELVDRGLAEIYPKPKG